ncbi:MAG: hypothetical protein ACE5GG_04130 [Candidatus Omnitrophota bacterium]
MKKIIFLVFFVNFANIILTGAVTAQSIPRDGMGKGMRDPFVSIIDIAREKYRKEKKEESPKEEKISLPPMDIEGIMMEDGNAVAIIDGEIIEKGDTLKGAKVELIDGQGATFNYRGQSIRLPFGEKQDVK